MTEQEAIKQFEERLSIPDYKEQIPEYYEAMELAVEVLERQVPKKILYRKQADRTPWLCAVCEADQIKVNFFRSDGSEPEEKHAYCWKCGQKLEWGKEE